MQKTICLIVLSLLMAGCVPMSQYRRLQKERDLCRQEMVEKDARLRAFNQLSPDGSLR